MMHDTQKSDDADEGKFLVSVFKEFIESNVYSSSRENQGINTLRYLAMTSPITCTQHQQRDGALSVNM